MEPVTTLGIGCALAVFYGAGVVTSNWIERKRRLRYSDETAKANELARKEHQIRCKSDAKVIELEERLRAEVDANMRLVRRMNQIREEMEQTQGRAAA